MGRRGRGRRPGSVHRPAGAAAPAFPEQVEAALYERLLAALEDLDDLRAYDEAKASGEAAIPLEQAITEIGRDR